MFRNTVMLNRTRGALVCVFCLWMISSSAGWAQEPGSDDEVESKPSTSVFGRLFGSNSNTKKQTPATAVKPKVPATPTAGKANRSGFMMPLKSFTKAFRSQPENEAPEEVEETAPRTIVPRIPREPFRNLPRVQERLDRATNDLQVEEYSSPSLPMNSSPAPIVKGEQIRTEAGIADGLKSLEGPKKNEGKLIKQPEMIIETNSTSRRTAMDILETATPNRSTIHPRVDPRLTASESASLNAKKNSTPKNLVDIGHSSSESTKTVESSKSGNGQSGQLTSLSREVTTKRSAERDKDVAHSNEISRHPRSTASTVRPDSKDKPQPAKESSQSSDILREMSIPGVKIAVQGPSSILIDEDGIYEVVAKNEGTEALHGLMVRIAVPAHVSVSKAVVSEGTAQPDNDQDGNAVVWELEHIPAGSSKSATISLKTAKPEHFALGVEWTVVPQSAEMQIQVQQPQLVLALEGPSEVEFGKPQMYRIRVRNPGNADVKGVAISLSAEPYGSNQSEIGDIGAGSERIVEVELTFQQTGTLPITASATSMISKLNAQSAIEVHVKQSELIANWFGPAEFYQGSVADYELELSNTGVIPAIGTMCKIKLPPGTDVSSMPAGASRSGDTLKWEIKKIEPQEKLSFPLRLVFSNLGENTLSFSAECNSGLECKTDFATNVDAIADLHLSVVDPVAPAPVGQPVIYEIIITNRGKKAATDVEVVAQFSDGIEPIRVEGHAGRIVPGQAVFNMIPSIGSNEKLVLQVVAQASKSGVHRFRAEVKCQGSETDLLEEESTRYLATTAKGERR